MIFLHVTNPLRLYRMCSFIDIQLLSHHCPIHPSHIHALPSHLFPFQDPSHGLMVLSPCGQGSQWGSEVELASPLPYTVGALLRLREGLLQSECDIMLG